MDPLIWFAESISPFSYWGDIWAVEGRSSVVALLYSLLSVCMPRLNPIALVFYVCAAYGIAVLWFIRWRGQMRAAAAAPIPEGTMKKRPDGADVVDVAIVGAGPSGATAAYFLARDGHKVALFDAKSFPRDKPCGDAVCKIAIELLAEMGLYPKLRDENLAKVADSGGFVSPSGIGYVGRSHDELGEIPAALAIKRTLLDMEIAFRAREIGADLREDCKITDAKYDSAAGLWSVYIDDAVVARSRVLVCADGSTSYLAQKLGLVDTKPTGVGGSQFFKGGTHNCDVDGIVYYAKDFLPGYAAIFVHPDPTGKSTDTKDGDLMLTSYFVPGNPNVLEKDIHKWHEHFLKEHKFCSAAIGPNADSEKARFAPLRLVAVPKPYGNAVIVIGDAAGYIDPLTGEGIHHAMESGKIAAGVLGECIRKGNFSEAAMAKYGRSTYASFAFDFPYSMIFAQIVYRYPILLDASARALQRGGPKLLARWADIMTGRVPKLALLKPAFAFPMAVETVRLLIEKYTGKTKLD